MKCTQLKCKNIAHRHNISSKFIHKHKTIHWITWEIIYLIIFLHNKFKYCYAFVHHIQYIYCEDDD